MSVGTMHGVCVCVFVCCVWVLRGRRQFGLLRLSWWQNRGKQHSDSWQAVAGQGKGGGGALDSAAAVAQASVDVVYHYIHAVPSQPSCVCVLCCAVLVSCGSGEVRVVGCTSADKYRKFIEKDPGLERRFQVNERGEGWCPEQQPRRQDPQVAHVLP